MHVEIEDIVNDRVKENIERIDSEEICETKNEIQLLREEFVTKITIDRIRMDERLTGVEKKNRKGKKKGDGRRAEMNRCVS